MKKTNLILILSLILISGCAITGQVIKDSCIDETNSALKDDCYVKLAVNTTNLDFCKKIEDKRTANSCYAKAAKEFSTCNLIEDDIYWRDICFKSVAESTLDVSLCFLIVDQESKNTCFYNIALDKIEVDLCKPITKDSKRDTCMYEIAKETNDISICPLISTKYNQNACLFKIAVNTQNSTICDMIDIVFMKQKCFNKINSTLIS